MCLWYPQLAAAFVLTVTATVLGGVLVAFGGYGTYFLSFEYSTGVGMGEPHVFYISMNCNSSVLNSYLTKETYMLK
jgi:hypothetical protein